MTNETFTPIPNLDNFFVSDYGRIRKGQRTFPKLKVNHRGTLVLRTCVEGEYRTNMVARIVYAAFVGDLSADMMVLHRDGDKLNCAAQNLYAVPKSEGAEKARAGRVKK